MGVKYLDEVLSDIKDEVESCVLNRENRELNDDCLRKRNPNE
jgi:hypothetical protein